MRKGLHLIAIGFLPNADPLVRWQEHWVSFLNTKGLIKRLDIFLRVASREYVLENADQF